MFDLEGKGIITWGEIDLLFGVLLIPMSSQEDIKKWAHSEQKNGLNFQQFTELLGSSQFRRVIEKGINIHADEQVKTIEAALNLFISCDFSMANIHKAFSIFKMFENGGTGIDISQHDDIRRILKLCKRMLSPMRLEDYITSLGKPVPQRLLLSQFFDLLQLTITIPDFSDDEYAQEVLFAAKRMKEREMNAMYSNQERLDPQNDLKEQQKKRQMILNTLSPYSDGGFDERLDSGLPKQQQSKQEDQDGNVIIFTKDGRLDTRENDVLGTTNLLLEVRDLQQESKQKAVQDKFGKQQKQDDNKNTQQSQSLLDVTVKLNKKDNNIETKRIGASQRLYSKPKYRPKNYHSDKEISKNKQYYVYQDSNATYGLPRTKEQVVLEQRNQFTPNPDMLKHATFPHVVPQIPDHLLSESDGISIDPTDRDRLIRPSQDEPQSLCLIQATEAHPKPPPPFIPYDVVDSPYFRSQQSKQLKESLFIMRDEANQEIQRQRRLEEE
ncbi:MAG: hypothetical protein EZS28_013310 [Streblomastix strix]|uniref:EF-hand domain-containing protein n=1 Tax=Streblomastix strix TaxID=222440 RepID=A0A5J4W8Z2_9EUKA|nr:MAG: hypothetical protein EZS28_013310 [Streblomastix strix]